MYCFNPTLVRLRQERGTAPLRARQTFQSHAGSIEARRLFLIPESQNQFQSHAGSIEASDFLERLMYLLKVSIPRWFD
mgnify:CR=1 FL=1